MTERTHEIRIESHPRSFTEWSDLCSPAGYKKEVVRTSCNGVSIGRLDSLKDAGKHLGTAQMLGNGVWLNCSGWVGSLRMERICQREVLGRCLRNDVPTNWRACLFQWPFSSLEDFNELHWTLPIKRRRKKKRDLEKIPSSLLIAGVVCLGVQLTTGSMYARMSQRINELCIYIYIHKVGECVCVRASACGTSK